MSLNTQEQMLIEQRVSNEAKSMVVAYLLLVFLGWFGVHRFYLGRTGTAVAQLLLFVFGLMTTFIGIGFLLLAGNGIWLLLDLFLIPGMVDGHRASLREQLTQNFSARPAAE